MKALVTSSWTRPRSLLAMNGWSLVGTTRFRNSLRSDSERLLYSRFVWCWSHWARIQTAGQSTFFA